MRHDRIRANGLGGTFSILLLGLGVTTALQLPLNHSEVEEIEWDLTSEGYSVAPIAATLPPKQCPPCFNCQLPAFKCGNYGTCSKYDGQCKCPEGWSGIDCLTPQCGSPAGGEHRRPRPDGEECECDEGWTGINCNVCETDDACANFPLDSFDTHALDENAPRNMTCFKGGQTVRKPQQMCDVTNQKILDMLPGRPPQITFGCKADDKTCQFEFWIGKVQSFYCALDHCTSSFQPGSTWNKTFMDCENIKCSCVTGRMLCGEEGSVDISEFLDEEIKGPANFECNVGSSCTFKEPAMNTLIHDIFGDGYITLKCKGGECLHYSQVPGFVPPKDQSATWVALSCAAAVTMVVLAAAGFWYAGRTSGTEGFSNIRLQSDEQAALMTDHVPAQLQFEKLTYNLPNHMILENVMGSVKSGQVMAIMGPSGAGKSTLLDILARKQKKGTVDGRVFINGREVDDVTFKKVMGFVDQEDTLMPTLTVYETVLYSALLRLPRDMSYEAKKFRTLETMHELGILGIKDSRIGESGKRSISGGEKRRVSIACELVTSPSILFLDEPTSGLDSFNALNVIESLVSLARDYNRTVVLTIHQPRSNIVSLFDQLVLLAKGRVVYSGELAKCQGYLESIGHPCPPAFNIADYLIDLTMSSLKESPHSKASPSVHSVTLNGEAQVTQREGSGPQASSPSPGDTEVRTTPPSLVDQPKTQPQSLLEQGANFLKHTTKVFDNLSSSSTRVETLKHPVPLTRLAQAYAESDIAKAIRADIDASHVTNDQLRDVAEESTMLRGRKRATRMTQFRILSGRAFKNLYRDPALLTSHYIGSIVIAFICGVLIYHVENDFSGFQNRIGIFLFTLALFGFSCLTTLSLFAHERLLFMRERSNGYYSTLTYFSSKVLFDVLPLRVVPPLLYGSILYGLVGMVPSVSGFWKFLLTLILFNVTTASVLLFLSIAISHTGVASLVGTLLMLYNLLFAGLLINRRSVPVYVEWLFSTSWFHATLEALIVNELRGLSLKEVKYGVSIDVPAATILNIFGFDALAFWWDILSLAVMFTFFICLSYLWLHNYVKEKR